MNENYKIKKHVFSTNYSVIGEVESLDDAPEFILSYYKNANNGNAKILDHEVAWDAAFMAVAIGNHQLEVFTIEK